MLNLIMRLLTDQAAQIYAEANLSFMSIGTFTCNSFDGSYASRHAKTCRRA